MSLGLIFSFLFLFSNCLAFQVNLVEDGYIKTYTHIVKSDGLEYTKRSVNTSIPVSLTFEVSGVSDSDNIDLKWLYDSIQLNVIRSKTDILKSFDVYTTETFDKTKQLLTVKLHLTEKHFLPGMYTLIVKSGNDEVTANGTIYSAPVLPLFPKPKRVLEGDSMRLICSANSYPLPNEVSWSFAHIPLSKMDDSDILSSIISLLQPISQNEKHYVFESSSNKTINDTLRFEALKNTDNGVYACNVSTVSGTDITVLVVNVKDRWAALWPFIGIVTEVIILVVAILLYERHQLNQKKDVTRKVELNATAADQMAGGKVSSMHNNLVLPVNTDPGVGCDANVQNSATADMKESSRLRSSAK